MTVEQDFAEVASELEGLGLSNGSDFRVEGIGPPGLPGSEYVVLRTSGERGFEVFYLDMGQIQSMLITDDFARARTLFVDEAVKVAGSHRRGPLATDPDTSIPWNEALGRVTEPGPDA